jgi:energy-coupling factor transporter ATP-binding protein EcfA2
MMDRMSERVGHMAQERGLYPRMRVRDQLLYLGQLCGRTSGDVDRTVDTWLERLGLAGRTSDRLDALSHGNQQRVQLIAALVNEPDLLVLDEPFSGLDPIAMGTMSQLLGEVAAAGATVLFSSHQLDLVEDLCEDVVIIDHGRIVLHSATRIHPELQDLKVGDLVPYGAGVLARVEEIEPRKHLVAGETFVLRPLPGNRTRLLVRYQAMGFISAAACGVAPDAPLPGRLLHLALVCIPGAELTARAIDYFIADPLHHYMEAGMLQGIKQRAEGKLVAA